MVYKIFFTNLILIITILIAFSEELKSAEIDKTKIYYWIIYYMRISMFTIPAIIIYWIWT